MILEKHISGSRTRVRMLMLFGILMLLCNIIYKDIIVNYVNGNLCPRAGTLNERRIKWTPAIY